MSPEKILAREIEILHVRKRLHAGESYWSIAMDMGVSYQRVQQMVRIKGRRPNRCQGCGMVTKRIDGHHINYLTDKHKWLCPACHRRAHKTKRNGSPTPLVPAVIGVRTDGTRQLLQLWAKENPGVSWSHLLNNALKNELVRVVGRQKQAA